MPIVGDGEQWLWIGQEGGLGLQGGGGLVCKVKTFGFHPMSIHSCNKSLLRAYPVPGTVRNVRVSHVQKRILPCGTNILV